VKKRDKKKYARDATATRGFLLKKKDVEKRTKKMWWSPKE